MLYLLFLILILTIIVLYAVRGSADTESDFEIAIQKGEEVRSNPTINGRDVWQKLEVEYLKNNKTFKIKNSYLDFIENSGLHSELKTDYKDSTIKIGDETVDFGLPGHFLIQLIRLPLLAEDGILTYNKLMQIGYNIGQLKCVFKNEWRDKETIKRYVSDHKLFEMQTYV